MAKKNIRVKSRLIQDRIGDDTTAKSIIGERNIEVDNDGVGDVGTLEWQANTQSFKVEKIFAESEGTSLQGGSF